MSQPSVRNWTHEARFWIYLVFLAACFLMGGGSRLDILSLPILQPFAVLCLAALLLLPGRKDLAPLHVPLLLLLALAAIMMAQLIPLPPDVWAQLPGHARFAAIVDPAIGTRPWRPISITPDLTLASLVGLIVPATALIGFSTLTVEQNRRLLPFLLVMTTASIVLGLAQVAGGPNSALYFYRITNNDSLVGLFSNRNHQALLLAMTWPLLALWAIEPTDRKQPLKWVIVVAMALFLLPVLIATGSRGGLFLAVLGIAAAFLIARTGNSGLLRARLARFSRWIWAGAVAVAAMLVAATIVFSRDEALQRLIGTNFAQETRLQALPTLIRILRDFFPVGSGFGSFDPIYRAYEPVELLAPTYLNHAHDDLVELIITGGVAGLLVAALFILWLVRRIIVAFRAPRPSRRGDYARTASVMIAMILLSSLVDYPLRTPLMSAIFAIACGWLAQPSRGEEARLQGG